MNKITKVISLVLAIIMCISVCIVPTYAANDTERTIDKSAFATNYPYIFVHGMGGWGSDTFYYSLSPYWGGGLMPGSDTDIVKILNENGVEVSIDVRMPVGFENFAKKLDEVVPGSYESCMAAFDLSTRLFKALDSLEDLKKLPGSLKDIPDIMRMVSHTMTEALDALGMPKKAQDIFNTYWCYMGSPASQFDFLYYMAVLHSYVQNGTGIPKLRSHEMSLALDEVIRRHGGNIWYNSEVTKIIMKDGKPAGVVINGEKEVYGK